MPYPVRTVADVENHNFMVVGIIERNGIVNIRPKPWEAAV
jgi:hypothetical protein